MYVEIIVDFLDLHISAFLNEPIVFALVMCGWKSKQTSHVKIYDQKQLDRFLMCLLLSFAFHLN